MDTTQSNVNKTNACTHFFRVLVMFVVCTLMGSVCFAQYGQIKSFRYAMYNIGIEYIDLSEIEDINQQNNDLGITTLMRAAIGGADLDSIWDLRPDVNIQDKMGMTALMYATIFASEDTVSDLIKHGADVTIKNCSGSTALFFASRQDSNVINMLVRNGANVNEKDVFGMTPLMCVQLSGAAQILIKSGAAVNATDTEGMTPLIHAVKKGNHNLVLALLGAGADVSVKDKNGMTALMYAKALADEKNNDDKSSAESESTQIYELLQFYGVRK